MKITNDNKAIKTNYRNKIDGIQLLKSTPDEFISCCFFDPQYRGVLDKLKYGNEGVGRGKRRSSLQQMDEKTIINFIHEINRVLKKSGYLFLWIDKFHLCQGTLNWLDHTDLNIVDMIVWNKGKIGMGYRTRRKSEYLLIIQKTPTKAKSTWKNHSIPDIWEEKIVNKIHTHQKPVELQKVIIESVTNPGEYVLDPCAGSYSVLDGCLSSGRIFLGGDIEFGEPTQADIISNKP